MDRRNDSGQFAAFVGIDWADAKHDVCLKAADSEKVEHKVLAHKPEAIEQWAGALKKRFGKKPIAVCLELTRGPLVYALQKYDFLVIFPVNPATLAKYRQAWYPSKAKDDPRDARLALEVLTRHRDKLNALKPQSAEMRTLQRLVEDRRSVVNDRVSITNRITNAVKNYFPQVLKCFDETASDVFCDFLQRWPTVKEARRARKSTLEAFYLKHNSRSREKIESRIKEIKNAVPLTEDDGVIVPNKLFALSLITQLRPVLRAIENYDIEIGRVCKKLNDYAIFDSFPAAGPVFAPRLLAAFGEDRDRYANAGEIQRYSGVAPVTEASGNKHWVHWRYMCPKFLRQTFVEWAALTIPRSFWAEAYYRQQIAKGSSHNRAVRALAFKWIRILYRCWITRTRYDESTYLKALQARGSTLLNSIAESTTQG